MLIIGSYMKKINDPKEYLVKLFEMKILGSMKMILCMKINKDKSATKLKLS